MVNEDEYHGQSLYHISTFIKTEPVVRIVDGSCELNGLISSQAPTLDESSTEPQICVCFVVCVVHAMEDRRKLDEILHDIRETVDQLDITDWIPLVTFSRATFILLPLTRVGTSRRSDTGDKTAFSDSDDSANDSLDHDLIITHGGQSLESGIEQINNHMHDQSIPPTHCRIVVLIGNGCVNEDILDTNTFGVAPNKDPYSISVPFVISTAGVGIQTLKEENVLLTVALDYILPTPNISCQSEPAPIVVTRTQIIRMETSKLVDMINLNNEDVFFGSIFTSESTAEQVKAFHEEMRLNPNWYKEMVKIRTLGTTDLVSGEERQSPINCMSAERATHRARTVSRNRKMEGNESMERLRTCMIFPNAYQKLNEAVLEAEKGNGRKAKEMVQEAQQTVNSFVAPRLLSKERVLRRLIEVSSELGE
ncbi:hypothetical protein BLNAU_5472 [Blattamonas nauphoetae]|uniref:Uncharacterized protein n=1 Tax=Blattamonas nauphoetae TaxID=2049346 RepID=A0ABQ9Y6U9_9EUKA|nr:hypothetical protein BLNAU_5472 [Blattamonas nauphoetae]